MLDITAIRQTAMVDCDSSRYGHVPFHRINCSIQLTDACETVH